MKKSFLVIFVCVISVMLFQAFTTSKEPRFKNLQILPKDISGHDLDSIMHHFTAALGVKCNFCHVRNEEAKQMDFSNDAKPEKQIARKMMLMAIDINKNYFEGMDMDMDHDEMDHDMMNKSMDSSMNKKMDHKMMDTLMNADDSKYMLKSITCFTCHRGEEHPETKTPPHQEDSRPPAPVKSTDNK